MENRQAADTKNNIIAIVSYIMVGLALISIIVFMVQKLSSKPKIAALRDKGNAYVKAEDYEAAIATYNEAIAINPDNNDIRSRLKYAELKYSELMNNNISAPESEQTTVDKPIDTDDDIAEETELSAEDEEISKTSNNDPLGLAEEGLCGFTWNDLYRDDVEEYIQNYALNDSGIEFDEYHIANDGSSSSYWTSDDKPYYYSLYIQDNDISWSWFDNADAQKAQSKIVITYNAARNYMSFEGLTEDQCRFFGMSCEELINNELLENDILYSEGTVTKDGKLYGKSITFDFKTIQDIESTACFCYNLNDELYLITYVKEKN